MSITVTGDKKIFIVEQNTGLKEIPSAGGAAIQRSDGLQAECNEYSAVHTFKQTGEYYRKFGYTMGTDGWIRRNTL